MTDPALYQRLDPHLSRQYHPGPGPFTTVSLAGTRLAADHWGLSTRQAMIALLADQVWPLRLARNRGLLTAAEQARLLSSTVAVIGCGGLGGHLAALLARLGVGALTLCDGDCFDETNLNRQLFSREDNLGRNKAQAVADELTRLASHLDLTTHPVPARPDNLPAILDGADLVVDGLDSIRARRQVEAAAHAAGLTFVYGAIAGEEGLALVSRPDRPGLAAIYGPDPDGPDQGAETLLGSPTLTPAALAPLQATLALAELLNRGETEPQARHLDLSALTLDPYCL